MEQRQKDGRGGLQRLVCAEMLLWQKRNSPRVTNRNQQKRTVQKATSCLMIVPNKCKYDRMGMCELRLKE